MDVDESPVAAPEVLLPSHALDLLHIQVIDHFNRLLVELVGRVGQFGSNVIQGGTTRSIHAPKIPQKELTKWDAFECLEFLHSKRRSPPSNPRVEAFLSLPYSHRGARRGQDWARRDWEIALEALAKIGDLWQEGYIRESLAGLQPIFDNVFTMRMRPTGI